MRLRPLTAGPAPQAFDRDVTGLGRKGREHDRYRSYGQGAREVAHIVLNRRRLPDRIIEAAKIATAIRTVIGNVGIGVSHLVIDAGEIGLVGNAAIALD